MPTPQTHSEILSTGLHLAARSVYLVGEVSEPMLKQVLLAKEDLDVAGETITFYLSTGGGAIIDAMAIYDLLRSFRSHVRVVGTGAVWSAGVLILQAGDERLLTEHSTLLIHEGGYTDRERAGLEEAYRIAEEGLRLGRSFNQLIAERMGVTEKHFAKRYNSTTYLTSIEAFRVGLADSAF